MIKVIKIIGFLFIFLGVVPSYALSAKQVYTRVGGSVYTIYGMDMYSKKPIGLGSAVAVSREVLATNCHVALAGDYLVVKYNKKYKKAKIVYINKPQDLCLLKVNNVKFVPVTMRNAKAVEIGEDVFAIGNPSGIEKTLTRGIISNISNLEGDVILHTDADISKGSSGGGLFDSDGKLIGITTVVFGSSLNISTAIPSEWVIEALYVENQKGMKVITDKKPSPKTNTNKVRELASFGNGNVKLVDYKGTCLIYVWGRDQKNKVKSLMIWNPRYPIYLVFFPNYQSNIKTITIIRKYLSKTGDKPIKATSSILFVGKRVHKLWALKNTKKPYPLLFIKFKSSPASTLWKTRNVIALIDSSKYPGYYRRDVYKLQGFGDALVALHEKCSKN